MSRKRQKGWKVLYLYHNIQHFYICTNITYIKSHTSLHMSITNSITYNMNFQKTPPKSVVRSLCRSVGLDVHHWIMEFSTWQPTMTPRIWWNPVKSCEKLARSTRKVVKNDLVVVSGSTFTQFRKLAVGFQFAKKSSEIMGCCPPSHSSSSDSPEPPSLCASSISQRLLGSCKQKIQVRQPVVVDPNKTSYRLVVEIPLFTIVFNIQPVVGNGISEPSTVCIE